MGAVIVSVMVIAIASLVYFHYQDKKEAQNQVMSQPIRNMPLSVCWHFFKAHRHKVHLMMRLTR